MYCSRVHVYSTGSLEFWSDFGSRYQDLRTQATIIETESDLYLKSTYMSDAQISLLQLLQNTGGIALAFVKSMQRSAIQDWETADLFADVFSRFYVCAVE